MKTTRKQSFIALMTASLMAIPTLALAAEKPGNVTNVTLNPGETNLTINWDAVEDTANTTVDHYRIYYGDESVQQFEVASYANTVDTPDNKNTYELTNLEKNTEYFVAVTAVSTDDVQSLEYSIEANATTGAQASNNTSQSQSQTQNTQNKDTTPPTVANVIAADKTHVLVGFSEAVKLPANNPENAFSIAEQINQSNTLEVTGASLYSQDSADKTVVLTTAEQTKNTGYLLTVGINVTDKAGNNIVSANGDGGLFIGSDDATSTVSQNLKEEIDDAAQDLLDNDSNQENTNETENNAEKEDVNNNEEKNNEEAQAEDITPPEEAQNFELSFKEQLELFTIMMNWDDSINSAQDLMNYVLYISKDAGKTYDQITAVGNDVNNYEMKDLEGNQEYTFKITTKDEDGNESEGVIQSIKLPQTGLATGFLVFTSAFGANHVLKRRRKKLEH